MTVFENILSSLGTIFTPVTIVYVIAGTLMGVILGAHEGLNERRLTDAAGPLHEKSGASVRSALPFGELLVAFALKYGVHLLLLQNPEVNTGLYYA